MNKEQKYLARLLKRAVNKVYKEKRFLLQYSGGERRGLEQAFAFRTGIYLNSKIKRTKYKNLDVDSEYNKNHGDIKASINFPKGFRPDLIIHKRDSNKHNKLVIEFKGWWNNRIKTDILKLKDLTSTKGKYRYRLGVLIRLNNNYASYRYFIRGVEVDE